MTLAVPPTTEELAPLAVSRREVLRNLGYPRSRGPSARVAEALDRLWDRAAGLLAPRGVLRVVAGQAAAAAGMPGPTEWVGLGIVTAGPALEGAEREHSEAGQMLEALILDAYGSAAAEAAADALNLRLCRLAQAAGFQLPRRISPGYGRWAIEGQTALLRLLEAERIGVRLTEGLMMVPRKSVSFAVRFERDLRPGPSARRRCAACELVSCAYRADEPDDEDENEQTETDGANDETEA